MRLNHGKCVPNSIREGRVQRLLLREILNIPFIGMKTAWHIC
jgi:hypothetical protein